MLFLRGEGTHVQKSSTMDARDYEAVEAEPTSQDTGGDPDEEFVELDTRKGDKRNAPPRVEQQREKCDAREAEAGKA